jgi:hypothetical protein
VPTDDKPSAFDPRVSSGRPNPPPGAAGGPGREAGVPRPAGPETKTERGATDRDLEIFLADLPPPVTGGRELPPAPHSSGVRDFWALMGCNAIVFGSSVCIMVVELTASRLIAAYLGQSLYTWTSVIGVVLAGISAGNYLGGWLADRYDPRKVLSWLFLVSGMATFSVLFLNNLVASATRPESMSWQLWVMVVVASVFLFPAMSLGTISPVTASIALKRSARTGMTVGNIYAWGAMGSIVGTFLAGFWLIGEFGTRQIIVMTACVLLVMGTLIAGGQRAFRAAMLLALLQFVAIFGLYSTATSPGMAAVCRAIASVAVRTRQGWRDSEDTAAAWGARVGESLHKLGLEMALRRDDPNEYNDESDYFAIRIYDGYEKKQSANVKYLQLDYLLHSYYNPGNPTKLHYEYEQVYAAVTERAAQMANRTTQVLLPDRIPEGALEKELPRSVQFDAQTNTLQAKGGMTLGDLATVLAQGDQGEFRLALLTAWYEAEADRAATGRQATGGRFTALEKLPPGVRIPEMLSEKIRFYASKKGLMTLAPFRYHECISILAQGQHRDYVRAVIDLFERSRKTSTMFIGGGGFIFPRWIEEKFPREPRIDVAEIDPAVLRAVEKELGLPEEFGPPAEGKTYVRTHIGDARKFVDDQLRANKRRSGQTPPVTYDFVYGDAFNDLSVPWHLTTREFSQKIKSLLTPGEGVYLVNIIDIYPRAEFEIATGTPPVNLFPETPDSFNEWVISPAVPGLQAARREDNSAVGYMLGYRGVMGDNVRDQLLALASEDANLKQAIGRLYEKSHSELVGRFLGRYLNSACRIFPYVYLFTSDNGPPEADRDTFVVACSLKKLDFTDLHSSGAYWATGPFAWAENTGTDDVDQWHISGEMKSVLELARGQILEDDFAPVDNLLAPVFVSRGKQDD